VLVARRGTILLSKGYGWASKEGRVPNTPQTRFRLASVSKQFTALAIMKLQAQGKLSVHDPICTHLVDCPAHWRNITIHHLLTHTSGLPNYTEFPSFGAKRMIPTTPDELVGRFRQLRLLSKPGVVFKYQNSDYVLLGLIVERVSGQSYADFLRTSIFEPLDMSASGIAPSVGDAHVDAVGYRFWGRPARLLEPSTLYGCGSLASTVEDVYRWEQALSTNDLLPAAELEQIFTPYHRRYGYGWFVDRIDGRLRTWHPGKIDGFTSSIVRYPEEQVTVIVLSNLWTADADGISAHLADLASKY
jgi:CubicO group peptidase (beta-lactamase class C family)